MMTTLPHRASRLSPFYFILIPLLVWAVLQYILFQRHGLAVPPDATFRYIPHAQKMVVGYLDLGYDIRYVGYTSLIAATFKLNLSLVYLVYFQVLLSFVAVILMYKTAHALTANHFCAFVAALLLASSQDIQQWNYYILTESVFTTALIACFYWLVCSRGKTRLFLIPLVLYTCSVRPNGFMIVAAIFVYYFFSLYQSVGKTNKRNLELGIIVGGALLLLVANQLLSPFTIVETYARGEIIYGSSTYKITPPQDLQMPPQTALALQKIVLFFWENPAFALKQFFAKGLYFLAFIKPYFSPLHIALIALTVYPSYILATQAFVRPSTKPYALALLTVIGLETFIVMSTSEDWDCRFIVPILPFVFLLAALGLQNILERFSIDMPKILTRA
jgi:hypothetical protein